MDAAGWFFVGAFLFVSPATAKLNGNFRNWREIAFLENDALIDIIKKLS